MRPMAPLAPATAVAHPYHLQARLLPVPGEASERDGSTGHVRRSSDGSVQIVGLTGPPFAGTDRGHCIEAVLKSARVPPFKRPTVRLQYPFSLQ